MKNNNLVTLLCDKNQLHQTVDMEKLDWEKIAIIEGGKMIKPLGSTNNPLPYTDPQQNKRYR